MGFLLPGVPSPHLRHVTSALDPRGAHRSIRATVASGRGPASPPRSHSTSDARVPVTPVGSGGSPSVTCEASRDAHTQALLHSCTQTYWVGPPVGVGDRVGAGLTVPGPRALRVAFGRHRGQSQLRQRASASGSVGTPPGRVLSQLELGLWGPNMSLRTGVRRDFFGHHQGSSRTKNKRGYFCVTLRRPFRVLHEASYTS